MSEMEDVNGSLKQELNVANERIVLLQRSLQDLHNSSNLYLSDEDEKDAVDSEDEDEYVETNSSMLVRRSSQVS